MIDKQWADSLRALPEYQYSTEAPSRSLLEIVMEYLGAFLEEILDGSADTATDWVAYAAVLLAVVGTVYVLKRDGVSAPYLRGRGPMVRGGTADIPIDVNLLDAMRDAEQRKQFNVALRFVYLHTLRELSTRGQIEWRANIADSVYLRQMQHHVNYESFRDALGVFRRTWYGGTALDADRYTAARDGFLRCCHPGPTP